MSKTSWYPLLAVVLTTGCTVGQVVDGDFNAYRVGDGGLTFVGVSEDGVANGQRYEFPFIAGNAAYSSFVSFDQYAPATSGASGPKNIAEGILNGYYEVAIRSDAFNGLAVSPIFEHTYEGGCVDFYTQASDRLCAQYYFQITSECPTCCVNGACSGVATLQTQNGTKVLPILAHPF